MLFSSSLLLSDSFFHTKFQAAQLLNTLIIEAVKNKVRSGSTTLHDGDYDIKASILSSG
jgi:hypothetical protein